MRSDDAPSDASRRAAAAFTPARSPDERSASTAARTIGCTNRSGRPCSRNPAAASSSAAVAAAAGSTSARPAASRRSASPSTAAAHASSRAAEERRLRRCTTDCETVRGARAATREAAAVGPMPSSVIVRTSSWTRNGIPPVTSWHALAKAGSTSAPSPSCTSSATARSLNGASTRTSADGSAVSAASSGDPSGDCGGRAAATTASGSSSNLRPR
jgi:hypothetical protein